MLQNLLPVARILSPHFIREVYITKFLILFMFVTYIYICIYTYTYILSPSLVIF
jgi:hypothetical protein